MAAFTPIINPGEMPPGTSDIQAVYLLNELIRGYNERAYAIDPGATLYGQLGEAVGLEDLQDPSWWRDIQGKVFAIAMSGFFYDPTIPIGDIDKTNMVPFDQTSWEAFCDFTYASGGGFRRAETVWPRYDFVLWPTGWKDMHNPDYMFGPMQTDDIIGPWLWVDLQIALDSLRRTISGAKPRVILPPSGSDTDGWRGDASGDLLDCVDARIRCEDDWDAGGWSYSAPTNAYCYRSVIAIVPGAQLMIWVADRNRVAPASEMPLKYPADETYDMNLFGYVLGTDLLDIAVGLTLNEVNLLETDAGEAHDEWKSPNTYGDSATFPFDADPAAFCPIADGYASYCSIVFYFCRDWHWKYGV